jgi:positive phototaxis protein PixI
MTTNTTIAKLQQLLPQLFQPVAVTGDAYLRLQLTPELPALLAMEWVQEAMLVPASAIATLPNVPAFMIGMINARDRVFGVIDLAQFLAVAAPLRPQQTYQVIVVSLAHPASPAPGKLVGLAVSSIQGMTRFAAESLLPVGSEVPELLVPYLQGCLTTGGKQLVVIDLPATLTSSGLSVNPLAPSHS